MEYLDDKNVKYPEFAERFTKIRNFFCDGNNDILAEKIGVDKTAASSFCNGHRKAGEKKLSMVLQVFPEISRSWLFFGEGEMLRSSPSTQTTSQLPSDTTRTLPLIPFDAIAGLPSIDNIGVAFADCEQYVIPEFITRGANYLVRVSGSSMYPKYSNGDLLACKIVRDILFFQWGKVYVIDSSQGVLVKRIFQSDIADHIRLVSDNRDNYPPFDFPTSDIRSIAIVVGVIRFE